MVARGSSMRVVHDYWLVLLAIMIGAALVRGALAPL
jgi:hypothetical protein